MLANRESRVFRNKEVVDVEAVLVDADSHLAAIGRHNKNNGHLQMGINLTSHAIVVELLAVRTHSATVWQYPLYNARNCSGPLFRVLSPLPENGPIEQQSITWRARFF